MSVRALVVAMAIGVFISPVLPQTLNPIEKRLVEATNKLRLAEGLGKLEVNATLQVIAQKHAGNMASQDKYGDTDKDGHVLDGKGPVDRAKAGGYRYSRIGENVGANLGYAHPGAVVMEAWEKSPGHRKNLLTKEFTEIGVGAAQGKSGKWYFVQMFGRSASQALKVMVEIENRTGQKVRLRLINKDYALEAGNTGQFTCSTSGEPVVLSITWPDPQAEGTKLTLRDGGRYALVQKGGKFSVLMVGQ